MRSRVQPGRPLGLAEPHGADHLGVGRLEPLDVRADLPPLLIGQVGAIAAEEVGERHVAFESIQSRRHLLPCRPEVGRHGPASRRASVVVRDRDGREAKGLDGGPECPELAVDELGARLERERPAGLAQGVHAAADAVPGLEHDDVEPVPGQPAGRREPRRPGPHDQYWSTSRPSAVHQATRP